MSGWGKRNNDDHWSVPNFDLYGFRRQDLKKVAEKFGVDLEIPLIDIRALKADDETTTIKEGECEDIEALKKEIEFLKNEIQTLTKQKPILLGELRKDDPLLLAIEIRNSEWANYDPDNDRLTRGNQQSIKKALEEKGFTNRQAESIELVACPITR